MNDKKCISVISIMVLAVWVLVLLFYICVNTGGVGVGGRRVGGVFGWYYTRYQVTFSLYYLSPTHLMYICFLFMRDVQGVTMGERVGCGGRS